MWNFSSIKKKCNKDDKTPCGLMTTIYGLEKSVNKYFLRFD